MTKKENAWSGLLTLKEVAEYILTVNSATVIFWIVDDYRSVFTSDTATAFFNSLSEQNSLDWIWLQCHKLLGNEDEVEKLEAWLNFKQALQSS